MILLKALASQSGRFSCESDDGGVTGAIRCPHRRRLRRRSLLVADGGEGPRDRRRLRRRHGTARGVAGTVARCSTQIGQRLGKLSSFSIFQLIQFPTILQPCMLQESEPAAGTESIALRVAVAPARGIAGKVAQEGRYCEREEKTKGRNVDAIYFSML